MKDTMTPVKKPGENNNAENVFGGDGLWAWIWWIFSMNFLCFSSEHNRHGKETRENPFKPPNPAHRD